jgi:hypothetical protein
VSIFVSPDESENASKDILSPDVFIFNALIIALNAQVARVATVFDADCRSLTYCG